ncbi:metal ABC transporter solute-binding protein, Zn/Mn family [Acidihalobacter ferrooxydans]|uniref:High-affinity zinc uptake system protein ZnuA n=1 Tax=Acidihalobacter ferrooxydans TaxID=1765967 RepID=A0A1P8UK80_9GAMM|nr:zinc ABC transporter substrate-binding protein [Acidihalobacter ferrooxydans]APZ44243.1 hypothetical protein BW247_15045 [Acidihalobacter ferrooxydans]
MRRLLFVFLLCLAPLSASAAPLDVAVSILPQKYFVQTIGGDQVRVQVMVRPGYDPAIYAPTPRQLAELSQDRLYFAIGAPFERAWLPRFIAANPHMRIVDTQRGIQRLLPTTGLPGANPNPHIWLSPPLVRVQAANILRALVAADPAHAAAFRRGYAKLIATIDSVDTRIAHELLNTNLGNRRFMVFHPALYYFARSYDLQEIPIQIEGKEPSPRELAALIQTAHRDHIKVVFVEPQFSQKAARTIAAQLGGRVVSINPLPEDWPAGMLAIAKALRTALAQ